MTGKSNLCHPERSGEGTAKAAQSNGSLTLAPLSFRPREEAAATDRVEKSCAMRIGDKLFYRVRNGFNVLYKILRLASLAQDDREAAFVISTEKG